MQHLHQAANMIRVRMSSDHQVNALDPNTLEILDNPGIRIPAVDQHRLPIRSLEKDGISLPNINEVKS